MSDGRTWLCHFSSPEIWNTCSEEFGSRKEAIQFGMEEAKEWGVEQLHVGTKEDLDLDGVVRIDAEDVLEQIAQNAYDEAGEVAEDYLGYVTREQITELQGMLDDALKKWFTKHRHYPTFYAVDNIETIEVE